MRTSNAECRVAKLCAGVVPKPWLLRNRMSELFTYGSVGGAGYNPGLQGKARPYPEQDADVL